MKFVLLFIGLLVERYAQPFDQQRNPKWLNGLFARVFAKIAGLNQIVIWLAVALTIYLLTLPVLLVFNNLFGFWGSWLYFPLALVVLLLTLGPINFFKEFDSYMVSLKSEDHETTRRIAANLVVQKCENDEDLFRHVEKSMFIAANDRLFGVIFWFFVLGPVGAWLFRASEAMRDFAREQQEQTLAHFVAHEFFAVLSWIPSRLAVVSYAMVGSFDGAISDLKHYYSNCAEHMFEINDDVVACAGCGAVAANDSDDEHARLKLGFNLIQRALFLWLAVIALLTLAGWIA